MRRRYVAAIVASGLVLAAIVAVSLPRTRSLTFCVYDAAAKPERPGKPDKPGKPEPEPKPDYYEILGKWKTTPVKYVYSMPDLGEVLEASSEEWDMHTSTELVSIPSYDSTANFDPPMFRDRRNEVSFGDYAQEGVIAVCRMWMRGKRIVEFDMMLDTDFDWGDAQIEEGVMDIQNIATHEFGHGIAGLGDIYDYKYDYITMYGYADYGETQKRTIEAEDEEGLQANYGP